MQTIAQTIETRVSTSNVELVTIDQLTNILNNINTNGIAYNIFASVLQLTTPKTNKKCRDTKEPFLGTIQKLSKVNIQLNTLYANKVANQLNREDKPQDSYKKGFNTMVVDKSNSKNEFFGTFKGKAVIEYSPSSVTSVDYALNDTQTDKDSLPNVLPIRKKATNQGTSKEIFWRKLYLENVIEITINKTTYRIDRA